MRAAIPIAAVLLTTACGQTGALYLPDEGVETPVEIRSPAATPPAPAEEPASEDDEKKKSGPPPGR